MSIPAGSTIGSLVIEEKLATTAEGELFLARQPGLERRVLLRRLRRDLLNSAGLVERFRREARLSARVLHPNVAQVFDLFADRGDHYLVLERVEGPTLREILDQSGRPPARIAVRFALEIARGLEEIQRRGIVHCDLRPENVLVSRWGEVKLVGLGSAREVGDPEAPEPFEITAYTAPEIQQGLEAQGEADVYSLAALLCELLTGRPGGAGLAAAAALRPLLARSLRRALHERPESRPKLPSLRRTLERAVGRWGDPDPRIDIAAWMWEVRTLRAPSAASPAPASVEDAGQETARPRLGLASGIALRNLLQGNRPLPLAGIGGVAILLLAFLLSRGDSEPREPLPSVDAPPPVAAAPAAPATPPAQAAPASPQPVGDPARVTFVVVPWAEVQIDEQAPFLTPRAIPVDLAPGEHLLVFRHPRFGEVRRSLRLKQGEKRVVRHVYERTATP